MAEVLEQKKDDDDLPVICTFFAEDVISFDLDVRYLISIGIRIGRREVAFRGEISHEKTYLVECWNKGSSNPITFEFTSEDKAKMVKTKIYMKWRKFLLNQ